MSRGMQWAQRVLGRWLEPELFQPFLLGVLGSLSLSEFVRGALTLSLLPTYGRTQLGFAVEWTALALSVHYLVDNALRAPAGWLVDRTGARAAVLTGFGLAVAAVLGMKQAHTVGELLAALALYGAAVTPMWPAAVAAIGLSTPDEKRAAFMSYMYIFWLAGAGLGPVVINLVGGSYGTSFLLLAGVAALGLVVAWVWVRPPLPAATGMGPRAASGPAGWTEAVAGIRESRDGATHQANERSGQGSTAAGPWAVSDETAERVRRMARPRRGRRYWLGLWRNVRETAFLFPGMFAQTFAVSSLVPILSLYARVVLHLTGTQYSLVLVAGGALTVLLLIPAGRVVDKVGSRVFLTGGFFLAGTILALYPLHPGLLSTFIAVPLIGSSYAFILPAWNRVLDRSIDPDKKGTLWGVFMTVEGLGSTTGPYLGGLFWDVFGPRGPFWFSAAVILLMGALYLVLPIEARHARVRAAKARRSGRRREQGTPAEMAEMKVTNPRRQRGGVH
ncbi:MAG: MFS transporter [Alicyclobacillus sp.]|nr:MFS transporter [Alicyclobacillus sp.]